MCVGLGTCDFVEKVNTKDMKRLGTELVQDVKFVFVNNPRQREEGINRKPDWQC